MVVYRRPCGHKTNDKIKLKNAKFRIKDVPLLPLPYASIPIKKEDRQSGFLIPTGGYSKAKGAAAVDGLLPNARTFGRRRHFGPTSTRLAGSAMVSMFVRGQIHARISTLDFTLSKIASSDRKPMPIIPIRAVRSCMPRVFSIFQMVLPPPPMFG